MESLRVFSDLHARHVDYEPVHGTGNGRLDDLTDTGVFSRLGDHDIGIMKCGSSERSGQLAHTGYGTGPGRPETRDDLFQNPGISVFGRLNSNLAESAGRANTAIDRYIVVDDFGYGASGCIDHRPGFAGRSQSGDLLERRMASVTAHQGLGGSGYLIPSTLKSDFPTLLEAFGFG
jgi:hypothetical protein